MQWCRAIQASQNDRVLHEPELGLSFPQISGESPPILGSIGTCTVNAGISISEQPPSWDA